MSTLLITIRCFNRSSLLFFENWKNCSNFGENTLIVVIYALNLSLKCNFYEFPGEKSENFSLRNFLSRVVDNCLSKSPNSKKTPLPQNIPGWRLWLNIKGHFPKINFFGEQGKYIFNKFSKYLFTKNI